MKNILIIDDDKLNLATARKVLSDEYKVIPAIKGTQALTYLKSGDCDMILLDINMPEMDGFEVLKRIRKTEHCKDIPVIFLTADNDSETETRCFKEGASDYITKPFVPEVMRSRVGRALELEELRCSLARRLEQKTREVSDMKNKSCQDALTGLWNRAYTEETVNAMISQGTTGALMMIDLDNFKAINDNYGHIAGDRTLKMFADTLRDLAGEHDVLCRIGGDEFVVFIELALETLEKAICMSLRRSDVSTRYSSKQLIVILMDANEENGDMVAGRILKCFRELYTGGNIQIDYDIARMEDGNFVKGE